MTEIADNYTRARELSEQAVGEYAKGNKAVGDSLTEQAVKIDRSAVKEVVAELEQDVRAAGASSKPE